MLQKPGDRNPVGVGSLEELDRLLHRSVERAEEARDRIVSFTRGSGDLIVTFTGLGSVAAWVFTNFYQVLAQPRVSDPLPAYHASLHVAPYREEEYRVLHWMGSPWERGETARLADALYIMGVPALYIVPDEADPLLQQKVPEGASVELSGLLDQVMASAVSALGLAVERTGRGDMRVRRLEQELLTPEGVVEGLWGSYGAQLEELVSWARGGGVSIVHTRMLTPAAIALGETLARLGLSVSLWEASSAPPEGLGDRVLVLYTSTEADVWRDIYFRRMRTGGPGVRGLEIRTDPLSAQVYGVLLGIMAGLAGRGVI